MLDLTKEKIALTGGAGFLGRHILAELDSIGCRDVFVPRSKDYDLRTLRGIRRMLWDANPTVIIHAASLSGGIGMNQTRPAELFYDNIRIGTQILHEAYEAGVEKFVTIGTVCEYPVNTPTPFSEERLWDGYPESTNAPYGIAKKALLVMGQAYRAQYNFNATHLLLVNLFGPFDNFEPSSSHVIPALIRKFVEAKETGADEVTLWGSGMAGREFLYVTDAAEAIVKATQFYDGADPINVGSGEEIHIGALAMTIASMVGYRGTIKFDPSRPDGQPRRCLDVTKAEKLFNFKASTSLEVGLKRTIDWYLNERKQ